MRFSKLLAVVGSEPVFESSLLLAGEVDPFDVRRQLSRWVGDGRIVQLRRGLYTLAEPYQKVRPHPFLLANRLVRGSYVSCQSALAFHGLIPEHVPLVTSVSFGRPCRFTTPLGSFNFRHLKASLRWGYVITALGSQQEAQVATPAKAVLDLLYLTPSSDEAHYLRELRLEREDQLDPDVLEQHAARTGSPKLRRAAARLAVMLREQSEEGPRS